MKEKEGQFNSPTPMDLELKAMLDAMSVKYSNVEFAANNDEVPLDIRRRMLQEGWDYEGEFYLIAKSSAEETLSDSLGNPDYKIIIFDNRLIVFKRHKDK